MKNSVSICVAVLLCGLTACSSVDSTVNSTAGNSAKQTRERTGIIYQISGGTITKSFGMAATATAGQRNQVTLAYLIFATSIGNYAFTSGGESSTNLVPATGANSAMPVYVSWPPEKILYDFANDVDSLASQPSDQAITMVLTHVVQPGGLDLVSQTSVQFDGDPAKRFLAGAFVAPDVAYAPSFQKNVNIKFAIIDRY